MYRYGMHYHYDDKYCSQINSCMPFKLVFSNLCADRFKITILILSSDRPVCEFLDSETTQVVSTLTI